MMAMRAAATTIGRGRACACLIAAVVCISLLLSPLTAPTLRAVAGSSISELPGTSHAALQRTIAPSDVTVPAATPLMFVENVGQFGEGARFQVHSGNATLYLADDALWFTVGEQPKAPANPALPSALTARDEPIRDQSDTPRRGVNLKVTFPGANPHPAIEPFDGLETQVSYFRGRDPNHWYADVPVWGGVRYKDLYPGINLEVTSAGGDLVQRIVTQPGADLSQVALRVEGADALDVSDGALHAATAIGTLTLPMLRLDAGHASLAVRDAPARVVGDLVTVPFARSESQQSTAAGLGTSATGALLYSTFLAGSNDEHGQAIAVDGAGNAYVAGYSSSWDFPTTAGAFDTTHYGYTDMFVTKLNSGGTDVAYSTFLGGSARDSDVALGIAIDGAGNAYIAGCTGSGDYPTTAGAYDRLLDGTRDAVVTKLNATGTALSYSTYLGGTGDDYGRKIALDDAGNAYVTGWTESNDFPTTPGAFDTTFAGGYTDVFVARLNASGTGLVYSTYLGGAGYDYGHGIAVAADGNAYVAGETASSDFPTTVGAFDTTFAVGDWDVFVTRLNPSGTTLAYSTYLGGSGKDFGRGLSLDAAGNAYVTGDTTSHDFPTTAGAFDTTFAGGDWDAFVTRLNPSGTALAYSTYLGGSGDDHGCGIAAAADGNAYVTGNTASSDFPTTVGAFDTTFNGRTDAFFIKLAASGSVVAYASLLGGTADDDGSAVAIDWVGNAYLTGLTCSGDFPVTGGGYQTTFSWGVVHVFATKLRLFQPTYAVFVPSILRTEPPPLFDDFSWPGSGWTVEEDEVASLGYLDGEYRILVKQAGYIVRAGRSLLARDFSVEVDVREAAHTSGTVGLYFCYGANGYYLFEVHAGYGLYRLLRYDSNARSWSTLIAPTAHPQIRTGNATNRLRVVRYRKSIELYINGSLANQITDATLGEGYVGLAATGYAANFDARFDNFLLATTSGATSSASQPTAIQAASELDETPASDARSPGAMPPPWDVP